VAEAADMSEPDISAAMAQAMSTEGRRRELASAAPGLGAPLILPDLPYHSQSLGPVVGENHQLVAPVAETVHKAYGEPRPVYADPLLSGLGYAPVDARPALRGSLHDLADAVFSQQDRAAAGGIVYASAAPPAKPGLLARLAARLRRK
jgi:hypothetical protein